MPVKLESLRLDTLAGLDPRVEQLFQKHLTIIKADCTHRPNDLTPRKLTIELAFKPIPDDDGTLDEVEIEVAAQSKCPVYKTKPFRLKPTRDGLMFNADIPSELDQPSLM